MKQYLISGMSCAACQARVEKAVSAVPGVTECAVSLLTNSMRVEGTADAAAVIRAVEQAGYGAQEKDARRQKAVAAPQDILQDTETPKLKRRLVVSVVFLLALMYITMGHNMWDWPLPSYFAHNHLALTLTQLLLAAGVMIVNQKFFVSGFRALFSGAPNMDTLVSLGSGVSFAWSTFVFFQMCGAITRGETNMSLMEMYHNELYYESAAMIPALITVGKLLESVSKGRTTNALKSLIRLAPKKAVLIRDGEEIEVDIDRVQPGDVFAVRPGGIIPVDGVVLEGESAVDESALTGESIPVDKKADDRVSAATINRSGYLRCRATRVGEDTTLSQIIRMVSDAAETKAPIARIADNISGIFVPAVIALAILVTAGWLIAGQGLSYALARGICVLVISCPCALGLATPVAVMVGNGLGARNGILIKTGEAIETIGRVDTVVLDKTGTITQGTPQVTDIVPADIAGETALLQTALALETGSEHPLAKAVVQAAEARGIRAAETEKFRSLPGSGVEAERAGQTLRGGNRAFIEPTVTENAALFARGEQLAAEGKTPLYIAQGDTLLGVIAVADAIKPTSPAAVRALQQLGTRVVMLTGDHAQTAAYIGAQAGVSEVIADVLPDEKEAVIRSLQQTGKVAMVGDGINDAPALTRADVGIAIGAGTDVAIDSAQIVLMNSDLADVASAVRLGRGTLRNIRQNLFWAFFYNLICIPLAAGLFGWAMNPMYAAAAMSLSSVTVCLNALRLNLLSLRGGKRDRKHRQPKPQPVPGGDTILLRVGGMMCPHCEATVRQALESLSFIREASADHHAGTVKAMLSAQPDEDAIRQAVEENGYTYGGIES